VICLCRLSAHQAFFGNMLPGWWSISTGAGVKGAGSMETTMSTANSLFPSRNRWICRRREHLRSWRIQDRRCIGHRVATRLKPAHMLFPGVFITGSWAGRWGGERFFSFAGEPIHLRRARVLFGDADHAVLDHRDFARPAQDLDGGRLIARDAAATLGDQLLDQLGARGPSTRSFCCGSVRQGTLFPACGVTQRPRRREAAYGSGL
jgi:hypothetical protein